MTEDARNEAAATYMTLDLRIFHRPITSQALVPR